MVTSRLIQSRKIRKKWTGRGFECRFHACVLEKTTIESGPNRPQLESQGCSRYREQVQVRTER